MSYDVTFFDKLQTGSRASAEIVLPLVSSMLSFRTHLDVGCGVGTWVAAADEMGVESFGIDGDYVRPEQLQCRPEQFKAVNLSQPFDLGRRFDLVSSLEVAEHLDANDADSFVASVVTHGDVVLFSAAMPGQGGTHHVNEQWPSYWVAKFAGHGYEVFDVIRSQVWADERIKLYYRQNMLMFAKGPRAEALRSAVGSGPLDIVHPERLRQLQSRRGAQVVGLRQLARLAPGAVRRAARKRLSRH